MNLRAVLGGALLALLAVDVQDAAILILATIGQAKRWIVSPKKMKKTCQTMESQHLQIKTSRS